MPSKKLASRLFFNDALWAVTYRKDGKLLLTRYKDIQQMSPRLKAIIRGSTAFPESRFMAEILSITGIDPEMLISSPRYRGEKYVLTRQLYMMVQRNAFHRSLSEIALDWGQDHCNVIHAIREIGNQIETNHSFREATGRLFRMIEEHEVKRRGTV